MASPRAIPWLTNVRVVEVDTVFSRWRLTLRCGCIVTRRVKHHAHDRVTRPPRKCKCEVQKQCRYFVPCTEGGEVACAS
jgi:hypothetical protein